MVTGSATDADWAKDAAQARAKDSVMVTGSATDADWAKDAAQATDSVPLKAEYFAAPSA
jgi:hypothetical protein